MNEHEMQRLFAAYRDSLGTCGRVPHTPLRRPGGRLRWALAAVGAAAIGAATLWPTVATANALRRMRSALRYARTMEMTFEIQRPSGRWVVFNRKLYQHGVWRIEDTRTVGLSGLYLRKGDETLIDYRRLDYTVVRRTSDGPELYGGDRALDDAIASLGGREDGTTVRTEGCAPVDGVPAYLVVLDRPEDEFHRGNLHAQIVVDARTDLPVSTEAVETGTDGTGIRSTTHLRQTYRFNQLLPEALFRPDPRKPIVRLDEAKTALARRWRAPLAEVGGTKVWDASVAADGTVWLAVTADFTTVPRPSEILGGHYARLAVPAFQGENGAFSPDGRNVEVVGFCPVDPSGAAPQRVHVAFRKRDAVPAPPSPDDRPIIARLEFELRQESGQTPDYLTALANDRFRLEKDVLVWNARAKALEVEGRLVNAAQAYEACAVAYRKTIRYVGYQPLRRAGECYEKAGRGADAERVRAEADALLASRER